MWSVGSEPGYTDIMPYVKVSDECGVTDENDPLDLHDGHYYYINVRVSFIQKLSVCMWIGIQQESTDSTVLQL